MSIYPIQPSFCDTLLISWMITSLIPFRATEWPEMVGLGTHFLVSCAQTDQHRLCFNGYPQKVSRLGHIFWVCVHVQLKRVWCLRMCCVHDFKDLYSHFTNSCSFIFDQGLIGFIIHFLKVGMWLPAVSLSWAYKNSLQIGQKPKHNLHCSSNCCPSFETLY